MKRRAPMVTGRSPSIAAIVEAVAAQHGVGADEITGPSVAARVAHARDDVALLADRLSARPQSEISKALGRSPGFVNGARHYALTRATADPACRVRIEAAARAVIGHDVPGIAEHAPPAPPSPRPPAPEVPFAVILAAVSAQTRVPVPQLRAAGGRDRRVTEARRMALWLAAEVFGHGTAALSIDLVSATRATVERSVAHHRQLMALVPSVAAATRDLVEALRNRQPMEHAA